MPENTENHPVKPEKARAQSAEFLGILTGKDFIFNDGTNWTLPNPSYLPPSMLARYNEHLRFMNEDLDTETEEFEHPVTGNTVKREKKLWPLRYEGKLLIEDVLLCIALMGTSEEDNGEKDRDNYLADGTVPEVYKKFLAAGGVPGEVQVHWRVMQVQLEERLKRDPKSR